MDPLSAAIIGAAVIGGGASIYGQSRANKANIASAREQMEFQERMSSTAYRRAMEDARIAGLNPILMGKLGGASTPSGAMANSQNEYSDAANTAVGALRQVAEVAKLKEDTAISRTNAKFAERRAESELFLQAQNSRLMYSQIMSNNATALESAARLEAMKALLPGQKAQADFDAGIGGTLKRWIDVGGQAVGTAKQLKDLTKPDFLPGMKFKFDSKKHFIGDKGTGEIFNP